MPAFDQLKRASFRGVPFPVYSVTIRGGLREHVHEYPHTPGGASEKLGRKLYEVRMRAPFMNTLLSPQWKGLWPQGLASLRTFFEAELSGELHIPTIGTIQAYAVDWEQTMDAKIRSGEVAEFLFREDQASTFLTHALVRVTAQSLEARAADFKTEAATIVPALSIFDQINEAANSVLALADQAELAGNLFDAKLAGLLALLDAADREVDDLGLAKNWRVLDAMHELWAALLLLREDKQQKQARLRDWTVPLTMTITNAAIGIYGDTAKAPELLQLNALEDPFAIPAGTRLRYYEQTAGA